MSSPTVSAAAERLYARMRAFQDGDETNGWMLLHLCEATAQIVAKSNDALRQDAQGSGGRRMHDPDRAPAWALPWLAQHAGLQPFGAGLTEEQQRALLRDVPNFRRGTPAAMIAAAKPLLTGTQTVVFEERAGGAYDLTVVTRTSETPDSAAVLAALLSQKPAGIILTYTVVDGTTWDEAVSTWNSVDSALTWDASLSTTV